MYINKIKNLSDINNESSIYDILNYIGSDNINDLNPIISILDEVNYKINLDSINNSDNYIFNFTIDSIKLLEYYNININLINIKVIGRLYDNVLEYLYNNRLYDFKYKLFDYVRKYNYKYIFKLLDVDVTTYRKNGYSLYAFINDFEFFIDLYETYNILPISKDYKYRYHIYNIDNLYIYVLYIIDKIDYNYFKNLDDAIKLELIYTCIYHSCHHKITKKSYKILNKLIDNLTDDKVITNNKIFRYLSNFDVNIKSEGYDIKLWVKLVERISHIKIAKYTVKDDKINGCIVLIRFYCLYYLYINSNILNEIDFINEFGITTELIKNSELYIINPNAENQNTTEFYFKLKEYYNF